MPIDTTRVFKPLNIAVLTVSDSRSLAEDTSGQVLQDNLEAAGHHLAKRAVIKDDRDQIADLFTSWSAQEDIDVIVSTGGTGLTGRDVTPEALQQVAEKEIPGFGEYFRVISAQKIGSSTVQSRATAGVCTGTYIFCLPGSPSACRDGWEHILKDQLDSRHRPCNFAELLPRLKEN